MPGGAELNSYLFPRWFADTTVPVLDGEPLLLAEENHEYIFYLSWLADYLPTIIPRGTEITDLGFETRRGEGAGIGGYAFFHLEWCFWPLEMYLEDGASYEDAYDEVKKSHRGTHGNRSSEWEMIPPITDQISPEIWDNAVREYSALQEFPESHLDIGYRHLLAPLVAGAETPQERYEILHSFYQAFDEDLMK